MTCYFFLSVVSQSFGLLAMGRLLVLNYKGDWFKLNLCDRVWNYEDAQVLNSFDNHQDSSEKGISKLCLINELDDNLLLAASSASWSLLHFAYAKFVVALIKWCLFVCWCRWWKCACLEGFYSEEQAEACNSFFLSSRPTKKCNQKYDCWLAAEVQLHGMAIGHQSSPSYPFISHIFIWKEAVNLQFSNVKMATFFTYSRLAIWIRSFEIPYSKFWAWVCTKNLFEYKYFVCAILFPEATLYLSLGDTFNILLLKCLLISHIFG